LALFRALSAVPNTIGRPQVNSAQAFAPAAITNFFEISYDHSPTAVGATGGGYILSKGTTSKVSLGPKGYSEIRTSVNGDFAYNARTTRRALELLFSAARVAPRGIRIDQQVGTPIGAGFGASGAAAISGVYAAASAVGISRSDRELALFAHRAEILEQTGLGTVSVIFNSVGAGAVVAPGEPGVARFVGVKAPGDLRIVTAVVGPYDKRDALGSKPVSEKINLLGHIALEGVLADPTLNTLAGEGERFSRSLGLESPEVKKLIATAKSAGAEYASQNMIGYAVHALTNVDTGWKVASALRRFSPDVRVDTFGLGRHSASLVRPSRR